MSYQSTSVINPKCSRRKRDLFRIEISCDEKLEKSLVLFGEAECVQKPQYECNVGELYHKAFSLMGNQGHSQILISTRAFQHNPESESLKTGKFYLVQS